MKNGNLKFNKTITFTKPSSLHGSKKVFVFDIVKINASFENDVFQLHFDIVEEDREILYQWTKEICEYHLHQYFERRDKREN